MSRGKEYAARPLATEYPMSFQINALPMSDFEPLLTLSEADLAARNMRRVVADGRPVYPCRVSLQDAMEGEEVLLLSYAHHEVATPYCASGPIYVRRTAIQARPARNEVPQLLRARELSLRGYDRNGMMVWAEVVPGSEVEQGIERLFSLARTNYLHIHYARPGCYACRVDRA